LGWKAAETCSDKNRITESAIKTLLVKLGPDCRPLSARASIMNDSLRGLCVIKNKWRVYADWLEFQNFAEKTGARLTVGLNSSCCELENDCVSDINWEYW